MFAIRYIASLFANPNIPQETNIEIPAATDTSSPARSSTTPDTMENLACGDQQATGFIPIKRENGFGDFCFDSVAMRNERYERYEREKREKREKKSPSNCTIVESSRPRGGVLRRQVMEDLIRLGTFPFMRLPIEIRERIYRWVAMPYNYDGEQQFDIRIQRFYGLNEFTKQLYASGFNDRFALMDNELAALDTQNERHALFLLKQADFKEKYALHPERDSDYLFSTNVKAKPSASRMTKKLTEEDKWAIEWKREVSVEMIRNLSNVSSEVRNELGKVLWRNVHIECDDYCHDQLVGFLKERPSIHAGIKSLQITISIESENPQDRNRNLAKFYNFCDYLSMTLTLDTLHVFFYFHLKDAEQISKCEGNFAFLAALRKVRVEGRFLINGLLYASSKDDENYVKRVMIPTILKMRWGLMPYTLLESEPTTEQEGYLRERKRLVYRSQKHERRISRVRSVSE